jgi:predicted SnoaL-like aldol condensation-catalyzing enzyme
MATSDIEKVLTVFQGIGNRDPNLAIKYMHPTKYTQHNPFASDGIAGVVEWIAQLSPEKSPIKVIRAFQDGDHVFTHAEANVLGQNVFFDIFRFEDGLIIQHYDLFTAMAPPNESGHTQTDGPTQAKPDQDKEKNKSLIREYYETVHISGDHTKVPQYCGDLCIRHESGVRDGMTAFIRDLAAATNHGKQSRSIDEVKFVLGQGDFVFVAAIGSLEGKACAYCALYRVEDEKIAEHWGLIQEVPPKEKQKNDNGIL